MNTYTSCSFSVALLTAFAAPGGRDSARLNKTVGPLSSYHQQPQMLPTQSVRTQTNCDRSRIDYLINNSIFIQVVMEQPYQHLETSYSPASDCLSVVWFWAGSVQQLFGVFPIKIATICS